MLYCVFLSHIFMHSDAFVWVLRKADFWDKDLGLGHLFGRWSQGAQVWKWGKWVKESKWPMQGSISERLSREQLLSDPESCWPWSQHLPGGREGCCIYHWLPFYHGWDLPLGALAPLPLSELHLRVITWCPVVTEKAITQNRWVGWVLEVGVSCKLRWVPGIRDKASTTS